MGERKKKEVRNRKDGYESKERKNGYLHNTMIRTTTRKVTSVVSGRPRDWFSQRFGVGKIWKTNCQKEFYPV